MADETTATDDTSADSQQTTDEVENEQSTETTSEENSEETTSKTESEETPGAPETYADFTMPEGVEIDTDVMGEFSKLAKDANLTQEAAQSLVELGAKMAKGFETSATESLENLKTSFSELLANDTELGGENLDANLAVAQRAIDAFGTKELKEMLDGSGLNKHPDLVRFFYKVGQTVAEDTQGDGSSDGSGQKSLASRMYGDSEAA